MKVDAVVKKETRTIAIGIIACSIITILIFIIIEKYNLDVLFGAIYGGAIALFNFFLMCMTLQNVAGMDDGNMAKKKIQLSYSMRQLGILLLVAIGLFLSYGLEVMNWVPMIIALVYPRITIAIVFMYKKRKGVE